MDARQNNEVFYGYKNRRFFDIEKPEEIRMQKMIDVMNKVIDRVQMKEELNLLGDLMHKYLRPNQIQKIVQRFHFLPINWVSDPALYTE